MRDIRSAVLCAASLLLVTSLSARAQPGGAHGGDSAANPPAGKSGGSSAAGGKDSAADPADSKDPAEMDKKLNIRLKLNDKPKGECTCKEGKLKGDIVEYKTCKHSKLEGYEEEAVKQGIIGKDKQAEMDAKKKMLAAKLAFLKKAGEAAKQNKEKLQSAKEDIEYKKAAGAEKKLKEQLKSAMDECKKDAANDLNCEGGSGKGAAPSGADSPSNR